MIDLVTYDPTHALAMRVQELQPVEMTPEYAQSMLAGPAVTGLLKGQPLFCVGKVPVWRRRWLVWALLSEDAKHHMLRITRIMLRLAELQRGTGRHEVIVSTSFKQAHRWAKMAGFAWHHHEEQFLPDGRDADIYIRFC